jgi:hypothetical protein
MIENTTKTDPRLLLLDAMMGTDPSDSIVRMEKRGQAQLVNSDRLPTDTRGKDDAFRALGFTFGDADSGDEMFRPATLPSGWKREGSDHAMWSYIVDERGIRRVAIFYKAAFYDRSAHMYLTNVGRETASAVIYGKEPITAESLRLAQLTDAERADLVAEIHDYAERVNSPSKVYADLAPRVTEALAIIG